MDTIHNIIYVKKIYVAYCNDVDAHNYIDGLFPNIVHSLSLTPHLLKFYIVWIEESIRPFLLESFVLVWAISDPDGHLDLR